LEKDIEYKGGRVLNIGRILGEGDFTGKDRKANVC